MDTRRLEVVIDDYGPWMLDGSSGEGEAEMKVLFTPGPSFGSICVLYR
jgi:glyoxylase-like metal-dependent hydrolase (beta-lactamase superfamily II)